MAHYHPLAINLIMHALERTLMYVLFNPTLVPGPLLNIWAMGAMI